MKSRFVLFLYTIGLFVVAPTAGAMNDSGPFAISNIATTAATNCSATDATVTLTIDPSQQGLSPYDISLDNGATWVEEDLVPNGSGEIAVTNQAWGTYALAVRDANGDVIYPGYAQIIGCSINVPTVAGEVFSTTAVTGATGYTWTTDVGVITAGQGSISATLDFSAESPGATGTICVLPTGPTCAAPATCFSIVVTTTISGIVFEDINYGGGTGRNFAIANASAQASGWANGDIGIENTRVELYSAAGAYLDAVTTDAGGNYQFEGVAPASYYVRFASRTATSNRGSNTTAESAYSVPTFRSVGATAYGAEVGGVDPTKPDAGSNATSSNISTLTTAATVAQAVSSVTVTTSSLSNVNLGLSFNVVTNTNDAGIGSLRQWVINAEELDNINIDLEDDPTGRPQLGKPAGVDVSIFEILGAGPHTISILSTLPVLYDDMSHATGYTQQGSVQGTPLSRVVKIGIDGSAGNFDAFHFRADDLTLSGFAIYQVYHSVFIRPPGRYNSYVWGNFIGFETDGLTPGVNSNIAVYVLSQYSGWVGTNGDGVDDLNESNVISNSYEGIKLRASTGYLIAGNYIGPDKTGVAGVGNAFVGIYDWACNGRNVIGLDATIPTLTAEAARNIFSANRNGGIHVDGSNAQVIAGNYFGTDKHGTTALANTDFAVRYGNSVNSNIIGTDSDGIRDAEERNIISGNGSGIVFQNDATGAGNVIAGNYMGVDITGNTVLPNTGDGIILEGLITGTIIGTNGDGVRDAVERNVISGNDANGISFIGTNDVTVSGNYIGVGADGSTVIPNDEHGINIAATSADNFIGYKLGTVSSDPSVVGNLIRSNGESGIALTGTGLNNRMSRNMYGNNGELAIDFNADLVTVNDNGDGDSGPNNLLNYPVLNYSRVDATTIRIRGFAPAGSNMELYLADAGPNPNPLPAGYTSSFGEGFTYLGDMVEGSGSDDDATSDTYTDDGSGSITTKTQQQFSFDIPLASLATTLSLGGRLTAISIDATGNTSEFCGVLPLRFIEICNDLIDNDGDGEIDCEDDDCPNVNVVSTVAN